MMILETVQNILENATAFSVVIGAAVLGVTQLVKKYIAIPKGYIPWVAVGIGILVGLFAPAYIDGASDINVNLLTRILGGAIAGFSATGMFEAVFKFKERQEAQGGANE
jgi:hypothetical protein